MSYAVEAKEQLWDLHRNETIRIGGRAGDPTLLIYDTRNGMSFSVRALLKPDVLDRRLEWETAALRYKRHYSGVTEEDKLQREFKIELRVDFADEDKLEPLRLTLIQAARHCLATAQLLSDTPKTTQVAVHCDDFFHGPQEIAVLEDTISQGLAQLSPDAAKAEAVSDELLDAFK